MPSFLTRSEAAAAVLYRIDRARKALEYDENPAIVEAELLRALHLVRGWIHAPDDHEVDMDPERDEAGQERDAT
jgi:hypothetical protein